MSKAMPAKMRMVIKRCRDAHLGVSDKTYAAYLRWSMETLTPATRTGLRRFATKHGAKLRNTRVTERMTVTAEAVLIADLRDIAHRRGVSLNALALEGLKALVFAEEIDKEGERHDG